MQELTVLLIAALCSLPLGMAFMLRLLLAPQPEARTVPVVALLSVWGLAHLCVLLLSRTPTNIACPHFAVAEACVLALAWPVRAEIHSRSPTGLLAFGRRHNAEKLSCAGVALLFAHVGAVAWALYTSVWPVRATTAAYQALNLHRLGRGRRWVARQARGGLHNVPLRATGRVAYVRAQARLTLQWLFCAQALHLLYALVWVALATPFCSSLPALLLATMGSLLAFSELWFCARQLHNYHEARAEAVKRKRARRLASCSDLPSV